MNYCELAPGTLHVTSQRSRVVSVMCSQPPWWGAETALHLSIIWYLGSNIENLIFWTPVFWAFCGSKTQILAHTPPARILVSSDFKILRDSNTFMSQFFIPTAGFFLCQIRRLNPRGLQSLWLFYNLASCAIKDLFSQFQWLETPPWSHIWGPTLVLEHLS